MRATPYFIKTKTEQGWILRVSGLPGCSVYYVGGNPKATPREAADSYWPALQESNPTRAGVLRPASPAQIKKAIHAGFYNREG